MSIGRFFDCSRYPQSDRRDKRPELSTAGDRWEEGKGREDDPNAGADK
jgi:hypothetical protein